MRYLSVCSGIEAATVAWHPLGWTPVAFSEIDKAACRLLKHHYPDVPNWGDMTKFKEWPDAAVDVLVGGTPCQSFSVAGLRQGMDDPRGNLALTYLAIADRYKPTYIVWENVPGVLSSNGGRDFGSIIGGMGEIGYSVAYRVLDAQYFGLAQRRERVFVVGYLGDWRPPAAVLFESESLLGHPAPRREARKDVAAGTLRSTRGGSDVDHARGNQLVPIVMSSGQANAEIREDGGATTLTCLHEAPIVAFKASHFTRGKDGAPSEIVPPLSADADKGDQDTLVLAHAFDARQSDVIQYGDMSGPLDTDGHTIGVLAFSGKDHGADAMHDLSPTLRAGGHHKSHANGGVAPAIAFDTTQITHPANRSNPKAGDPCHPLAAGAHPPTVALQEKENGTAPETYAAETLRALRDAVGEEAFSKWRSGIVAALQSPEILQSAVHGAGVRRAAREAGCWLDDRSLACPESLPAGPLRSLWEDGPDGRTSQGFQLAQQLAGQLGTTLPRLPHTNPPRYVVRRLTPKEAERLMGFPDGYTQVPVGNKPTADGPRYKQLGNSMAVPVMAWIGQRIAMLESLNERAAA